MKRREFVAIGAAAVIVAPMATQAGGVEYTPGLVKSELAAGKTVFLDFTAGWCATCAAQGRVIDALQDQNPDYAANISFIDVDWDEFGKGQLSRLLKIPRRSTLVVLKGNQELGRNVAGTSRSSIKQLMDIALKASLS